METPILHCDLNGFFASVECLLDPAIRHLPVAVGGDVEARHGIVLAKNEIAKKYKIKTGEALWQARQKCPQLHFVKPSYQRYTDFSKAAQRIYLDYSEKVESFGIDECWLDVSGSALLFKDGDEVAGIIRARIEEELGITCSIGVSWNKVFAKLGSDMKKPNAITVITRQNYRDKVWPLPVSDLLYVGPATTKKLRNYGVYTIGGLAQLDPDFLRRSLGKQGELIWRYANGLDVAPVHNLDWRTAIKGIGNSTTTPYDLTTNADVKRIFYMLAESVAQRLRKNGLKAKLVQIWIRSSDLSGFERQAPLAQPTCLTGEIAESAYKIFLPNYDWQRPIRSLGIRATMLSPLQNDRQYDLFENEQSRERWENIEHCIDGLRARFGSKIMTRALLVQEQTKIRANEGAPTFMHSAEISEADEYRLKNE